MVQLHNSIKISTIPFPFPYAQTCEVCLLMHWLVTPLVISHWVRTPVGAFVFSFIQIFILWSLHCIAVELENPFGHDENDMDAKGMQMEFNEHLSLLLKRTTCRTPVLKRDWELRPHSPSSFFQIWSLLEERNQILPLLRI